MISKLSFESSLIEIGTLHYEKGELLKAESYLVEAKKECLTQKKIGSYFKVCQMLIRSYVEMDNIEKIKQLKKELQSFILEENVEMSSRLYYTLGVCAAVEGEREASLTFFNQAFNMALAESNKEDMCYALSGKAIWYRANKEYEKASSTIENIKLFLEVVNSPAIEVTTYLCESQVLVEIGKTDEAFDVLWKALNVSKKTKANRLFTSYVLLQLGVVSAKNKDFSLAENYFDLAKSTLDPGVHIRAYKFYKKCIENLSIENIKTADIKIDLNNYSVQEISKGKLEFKNQFILLELLVEFVKNRERFLTKADLAELLWKQDYDPLIHDNKIYVTIRRLRKILEPDSKAPKYILRTKEGYQLSSSTIVEVI